MNINLKFQHGLLRQMGVYPDIQVFGETLNGGNLPDGGVIFVSPSGTLSDIKAIIGRPNGQSYELIKFNDDGFPVTKEGGVYGLLDHYVKDNFLRRIKPRFARPIPMVVLVWQSVEINKFMYLGGSITSSGDRTKGYYVSSSAAPPTGGFASFGSDGFVSFGADWLSTDHPEDTQTFKVFEEFLDFLKKLRKVNNCVFVEHGSYLKVGPTGEFSPDERNEKSFHWHRWNMKP